MAFGEERRRGLLKVGGGVLWAGMCLGMSVGMMPPVWGQAEIRTHVAPAPSERFPADWYPVDSDVTYTTAPVLGAPYTGTLVMTGSYTNGKTGEVTRIPQTGLQARDSLGRGRTEQKMLRESVDGSGTVTEAREVRVSDPVSHCGFRWMEPWVAAGRPRATVTCMPRTLHYGEGGGIADDIKTERTEVHPSANEVVRTDPLGERMFGEVKAAGVRRTTQRTDAETGAVRESVTEVWYSRELREVMALRSGGAGMEGTGYELTGVVRGEPRAGSFYPPAGYEIEKGN